jgi:GNAT superfamily N-acetyltransferase
MSDHDPHANWPDRTPLYDDGRLVLVFSLAESLRGGRPWADVAWRPPDVAPETAADAALTTLAGYAFSTGDAALVELLAAAGATEMRHAHGMSHALSDIPDLVTPAGLDVSRLSAAELEQESAALGALNAAAYPPGHPDHEHADGDEAARQLIAFARGEILGPYSDASTVARLDGRLAGACIVVDSKSAPPKGGPWIVDVFRDPDIGVHGVGAAMICASLRLAREAEASSVGLAVTHANTQAFEVYKQVGFADVAETWTLALP